MEDAGAEVMTVEWFCIDSSSVPVFHFRCPCSSERCSANGPFPEGRLPFVAHLPGRVRPLPPGPGRAEEQLSGVLWPWAFRGIVVAVLSRALTECVRLPRCSRSRNGRAVPGAGHSLCIGAIGTFSPSAAERAFLSSALCREPRWQRGGARPFRGRAGAGGCSCSRRRRAAPRRPPACPGAGRRRHLVAAGVVSPLSGQPPVTSAAERRPRLLPGRLPCARREASAGEQ